MGIDAARGLQLWAEDAGASGRAIELLIRDDRSDPSLVSQHARDLLEGKQADVLAGPYSSGLTRAVAPIAEASGTVLWNHGGAADDLHQRGYRNLVSVLTPASRYFVPALRWTPNGPVLILRRATSGFAAAVAAGAESEACRQGRPVSIATYPKTPKELEDHVEQLKVKPPALLLAAGRLSDDIALARALPRQSQRPRTVLVGAPVRAFRAALGASVAGLAGPTQWVANNKVVPDFGPTARVFARRFRARFGVPPDYPAAQAYATGLIMNRCVELVGSTDQQRLRRAAAELECTTMFGHFRIDPRSGVQLGHDVHLIEWVGQRCRIVASNED